MLPIVLLVLDVIVNLATKHPDLADALVNQTKRALTHSGNFLAINRDRAIAQAVGLAAYRTTILDEYKRRTEMEKTNGTIQPQAKD